MNEKVSDSLKDMLIEAGKYFKAENYEKTMEIYQNAYKDHREEFTEKNKENYAKAVYYALIHDNKKTEDLELGGTIICNLVKQKDCSDNKRRDDIYTKAMIEIIGRFHRKGRNEKTLEWCDRLDPNLLSDKHSKGEHGNERPSDKEKWYMSKTKALFNTKQYDETVDLIDEAFSEVEWFMQQNRYWLNYNRGKSNKKLGNYDEAIDDLEFAYRKLKLWYVESNLGECYYHKEDYETALKYFIDACLNDRREIVKRVRIYRMMAKIFQEMGLNAVAEKHYKLHLSIPKPGKIPEEWEDDEEEIVSYDEDFEEIEHELRPLWIKYKFRDETAYEGIIKNVFEDSLNGIISSNGGIYPFDKEDFEGLDEELVEGLDVLFYLNKKGKPIYILIN